MASKGYLLFVVIEGKKNKQKAVPGHFSTESNKSYSSTNINGDKNHRNSPVD